MARTRQQRPSKPRRVPKKILHIPPELIQNGLRFDRPSESRPGSSAVASTRRMAKRKMGKQPTRKPGKQDFLLINTPGGASPTTSHQGSHSTSNYMTPQPILPYNSAISPPIVSPGFDLPPSQCQDVYQHELEVPNSWPAMIPHLGSLQPSLSEECPASSQIVPTSQVPNFTLQTHEVWEQSANQAPPTPGLPMTNWPELWDRVPSALNSMPVGAYAYSHSQEVLTLDLAMMYASDALGGTEPSDLPFPTSNFAYHPE